MQSELPVILPAEFFLFSELQPSASCYSVSSMPCPNYSGGWHGRTSCSWEDCLLTLFREHSASGIFCSVCAWGWEFWAQRNESARPWEGRSRKLGGTVQMGPRQRDRTFHSRTPLTSHAHPPLPVVGTLGLWNLTMPSSFFFRLACGTVSCIYLSLQKTKNWFGGSFHVLLFYLSS